MCHRLMIPETGTPVDEPNPVSCAGLVRAAGATEWAFARAGRTGDGLSPTWPAGAVQLEAPTPERVPGPAEPRPAAEADVMAPGA
jgi:hypothetical protein